MRKIRKSVRLADTLQSRQPPAADGLWQRRRRIVVAPPTDCGSAADGLWQRRRWIVVTPPLDCGNAAAGLKPCGLLARMRAMPWQVGIPPPPARAYGIGKKMHCQSQCEKSAKVCDWQTLYKAGSPHSRWITATASKQPHTDSYRRHTAARHARQQNHPVPFVAIIPRWIGGALFPSSSVKPNLVI